MYSLSIPFCAAALTVFLFTASRFFSDSRHLHVDEGDSVSGASGSAPVSQQSPILKEIKEKHRELLPYYTESTKETFLKVQWKERGDGDSDSLTNHGLARTKVKDILDVEESAGTGMIGCVQLSYFKNVDFLGSGYTKAVLKAVSPEGLPVALKSVNDRGTDMKRCLEDFGDVEGCYELVSYKLIKEIMLLQRLQHPNIIKLQGHCQGRDWGSGVTAALELGSPLQMIQLLQSPWEERFRICLSLVRLLHYLSISPLGSVALLDFQPRQFVVVSGELKLTDLDDASTEERSCRTDSDCTLTFPHRNFTFPCAAGGICEGLNEKTNLYNAYRYFFTYLLPHRAPPTLQHLIDNIMNSTGELRSGINETLEGFEEILQMYKSGRYLNNLPPSLLRGYTLVKGKRPVDSVDYRCWPSYNHQGCVLSVHSAREAAHICSSHPQCTSFSVSSQRTWTGRYLASFRSGFRDLIPDVKSALYVKKVCGSEAVA
ncbi:extracellular tyrosine-protein kinase PKDCC [Lepisosteus oculatus]|uniref:extracellular tyrosine-protein kinase PKDCC n=1 Tax=Lepisosteus oculatus TaxID=7918 RepID=UPI003719FD90